MMRRERGMALLLVLWATVLLAALLFGVAAASRSQGRAALYGAEQVRAGLAAEAGLAHAIAGLNVAPGRDRWVPDGRAYRFGFDGARVTVKVVDVTGLIDLNAAPLPLLRNLFLVAGADAGRAAQLADAIGAARAPSDRGLAARASRFAVPFRALEELANLPGMDADLYARVAPALTVFSGRSAPDPAYAGPLALAAARGVGLATATTEVDGRRRRPAQGQGGDVDTRSTGPGDTLVAGFGGAVKRVVSTAVMPDGTRAALDVSVRLALTAGPSRPYKVLDWRTDAVGAY